MTTTARADMATGLLGILTTAKNNGLLQEAHPARPGSLARPTPFGYVEMGPEAVAHDSGTRTRVISPSLVVVDRLTENAEVAARMDALIDSILDLITATPHISVASGVVHDGRMTIDVEVDQALDNTWYIAARFAYGDITVQEGRN